MRLVFVLGNHDYFGSDIETVDRYWADMSNMLEKHNIYILTPNKVVHLFGVKFIGSTLWTNPLRGNPPMFRQRQLSKMMSDQKQIQGFDLYAARKEHELQLAHLQHTFESISPEDNLVIVSHHLPFRASIAPEHFYDEANIFFSMDLDPACFQRKLGCVWIHGHTHTATTYMKGSVAVLCQPRGYPSEHTDGMLAKEFTL